jgi:hypothetical protein
MENSPETIVLKTKPVRPEKTWTVALTGFLRVTSPTKKKPKKTA